MLQDLILIHGMWCNATHWQPMRKLLEQQGFRCHIPTLPYHHPLTEAVIDPRLSKMSLKDYRYFLQNYMQQLPLTTVPIVVGHSMGSLLAQMLAETQPIKALVLIAPVVPPRGLSTDWHTIKHQLNYGLSKRHNQAHKISFRQACYHLFNCLPATHQQAYYNSLVPESARAAFELNAWLLDWQRAARVKIDKIKLPILALAGAEDHMIPLHITQRIKACYPQVDYRLYAQHGHWLIAEPELAVIVNDIKQWIEKLQRSL